MKFFDKVLNLLSQNHCVFCDYRFDVFCDQSICEKCATKLPYVSEKSCKICGRQLDIVCGELICMDCQNEKKSFIQNVATFIYKDNVRKAIKNLKFHKNQIWRAVPLGNELSKTVIEKYSDIAFDLVIPAPISSLRYLLRGYNQSEELANVVSKNINVKLETKALYKIKNNKKQSKLNKKERLENVKGVYAVKHPELIEDKIVLLIDDIYTTGATVGECSKVLLNAGASAVYCATLSIA